MVSFAETIESLFTFTASCLYYCFRLLFQYRKDDQFFRNYFHTLDRIAHGGPYCRQSLQLKLIYLFLLIRAIHCLVLTWSPPTTAYDVVVFFDYEQLTGSLPSTNLQLALMLLEEWYMFHIFYVQLANNPSMGLLHKVMVDHDLSFAHSRKPIDKHILRVLNICQPFVMIIGKKATWEKW